MKYFIENRITAYMIFLGLLIFGIIGMYKLPLSLLPPTAYPGITVIIEYSGITPEMIETILTKPVEKIIKTVPGIEKIDSTSEEGKCRINISFQIETDIKIAALKVREKIGLIRSSFPRAVQEPVVMRYDPSDKPALIATIEKKGESLKEIREFADRKIKMMLQRVEGVSEINIAGGEQREIHIDVDQGKFESRSVAFNGMTGAIQNSNISLPGGRMEHGGREFIVNSPDRYKTVSDVAHTVVMNTSHGSPVKISDFSEVSDTFKDREDIARLNGEERVTLYIHKAGDANILDVCRKASSLLSKIKEYDIKVIYDQGTYIQTAIDNVVHSCVVGMIIVIFVVFVFFRDLKYVLTIGLAIPFSSIVVFAFMYFARINIDVMSLSGIAVGGGMVVDNSIIVTAAIFSQKKINNETIYGGVSSVKNAIISSTLTTIIVFFPIVFGNIVTKRMYGGMAFSVSVAMLISLAVSIILVPAVYAEITLRGKKKKLVQPVKSEFSIRLNRHMDSFFSKVEGVEKDVYFRYERILDYALKNRRRVYASLGALLFLSLIMFTMIKSEFVDPTAPNEFYVYLEFPTGSNLAFSDMVVKQAEAHLKNMKVAKKVSTKVEKWRGTLTVSLNDDISSAREKEKAKETIKKELNALVRPHGAYAFVSEADESAARELNITFIGEDNDELQKLAKSAAKKVGAIPGMEECVLRFREGRPSYVLYVDHEKANMSNLNAYDIASFYHTAVYGPVVTKFVDADREVDLRIRFAKEYRDSIGKLMGYSIRNRNGEMIQGKEVVVLKEEIEPTKIWRENGRRCVYITAKLGKLSYDEAVRKISAGMKDVTFPPEYTYEYDENYKKMKKVKYDMMLLVALSIAFVYMIIAVFYESFTLPLLIMTTVPLALIGVVIALFLTLSTFNVSVYIGLIILAGIVVTKAILLVDVFEHNTKNIKIQVEDLAEVIKKLTIKLFRPTIATTLTAVMALVPALVNMGEGSNLWRPLSLTVISGLTFATLLTLVIIPLVYFDVKKMKIERSLI